MVDSNAVKLQLILSATPSFADNFSTAVDHNVTEMLQDIIGYLFQLVTYSPLKILFSIKLTKIGLYSDA